MSLYQNKVTSREVKEAERSESKQGHLQLSCYSRARSLSKQWSIAFGLMASTAIIWHILDTITKCKLIFLVKNAYRIHLAIKSISQHHFLIVPASCVYK